MFMFQKNVPNRIHASPSPLLRAITITCRRLCIDHIIRKTRRGDPPDFAAFDAHIYEAGNRRAFREVQLLLKQRWIDGGNCTSRNFFFIKYHTRDFYAVLRELYIYIADISNYECRKNAFDALIARLCDLNHHIDDCIRMTKRIADSGFGADVLTFYPILKNLALNRPKKRFADDMDAWDVIQIMKERGIWPNERAYLYLLKPVCLAGDVDAAARVLQAMEEDEVKVGEKTYGSLVLGACRGGKVEGALALLRRLEPVVLKKERYGDVVDEMIRQGLYEEAMEFVMGCYADKKGKEVDGWMFQRLAVGLIDTGKSRKAAVVLKGMMKRNLPLCKKLQVFCTKMRW